MGGFLDEKPPSINTDICDIYANPDEGTCSENCPFYVECTPWFEELAKILEDKCGSYFIKKK